MEKYLNTLKERKIIVIKEIVNIDTKKISKKWRLLYGIGLISMLVLTTILFYPDNLLLAFLLTTGYVVSVPAISALIDSIKVKKLNKELSFINNEIEETKKGIQNLTEEDIKMKVLEFPYELIKLPEIKRMEVLEKKELHSDLSTTVRIDNFNTTKECDQRKNLTHLSDNKKSYTRKKKR